MDQTSSFSVEPISLHSILKDMKLQLKLLNFNGNSWTIDEIKTVIVTRKVILLKKGNFVFKLKVFSKKFFKLKL